MSRTTEEKRAAFRALHREGCFVLPNPWDVSEMADLGVRRLSVGGSLASVGWAATIAAATAIKGGSFKPLGEGASGLNGIFEKFL
jgi:2-methylisocitrate lyase-like PEP mutase family enzyme